MDYKQKHSHAQLLQFQLTQSRSFINPIVNFVQHFLKRFVKVIFEINHYFIVVELNLCPFCLPLMGGKFSKNWGGGGGVQTSVRDLRVFSCITQMLLTFHKYLIHHKKEVHEVSLYFVF